MNQAARSPAIQRLNRLTAIWFAVFTALIGAVLGGLADLIAGDSATQDFAIRLWVTLGLAAGSLWALASGWRSWRTRDRLLSQRGKVYVVDSPAATWTPDEKRAFLAAAESEFVDIVYVPGPTGLTSWRWPHAAGAERWSDAVDDLVLSFRSVWANGDNATPNSVICWSWYAVAMAWSARLSSAERNVKLSVRQRPSTGREGRIELPPWDQRVHTFEAGSPSQRRGLTCPVRAAKVRVTRPDAADITHGDSWDGPVRILLVRATPQEWQGLTPDDDDTSVELHIENRSGQLLGSGGVAELHEWRCLLPERRKHPWDAYPDLVSEIADWIAASADHTALNFLGMLVPQEIGLGLGINVARRPDTAWPSHLWPIIKPSPTLGLMVPGLDLGWASLRRTYPDLPR